MLIARGTQSRPPARLTSSIILERAFRVHCVERAGAVWDTRYAPAVECADEGAAIVYFLLEGRFEWHGGPVFEAPCAFISDELDFEGESGRRRRTFRSTGEPYRSIEVRIAARDRAAGEPGPRRLELGPAIFQAAEAMVTALADERDPSADLRTVLGIFHERGVTTRDLGATIASEEPTRFRRIWDAVRGLYREISTNPSLTELALGANLSVRQVTRDFDELQATFPIHGDGWRSAIQTWRFRWAILLLSVPGLRILDIAKTVGYGSAEAMTSAFRNAGLETPTRIRQETCPLAG